MVNNVSNSTIRSQNKLTYSGKVNPGNKENQASFKAQLSKVLFGKNYSSGLTFGWSKSVESGSVQEKILNILTDPKNNTALVAAHGNPDGDAYGSNLGVSGILKNMGVKVFSVIDDYPKKRFAKMPSPEADKTATEYINAPRNIEQRMKAEGVNKFDVAVITDCPLPEFTSGYNKQNPVLDLALKAEKIIIIDHHPDTQGNKTNEEQWRSAYVSRGIAPENILYWRELRTSAAEMIGELDKEIVDENKLHKLPGYNPQYNGYKLAIACGIYTDAGGITDKKGMAKIARLSDKKVQAEDGKFMSITRNIFNWLVKNSGVKKTEVSFDKMTSLPMPDDLRQKMVDVVDGKLKVDGIEVKKPTRTDPFGYVFIEKRTFLDNIADEINKRNGYSTKDKKVTGSDIFKEIKEYSQGLQRDKNLGLYALVSTFPNKETNIPKLSMSIRSYGYNSLQGEIHVPGVFMDGAAVKATEALKYAELGDGGGHENATGFSSKPGIDFKLQVLPEMSKFVKEFIKDKDITSVPPEIKAQIVSFTAKPDKQIKLFG